MKKSFVIILMLLVSMMCVSSIALAQKTTTNLAATATIGALIPVDLDPVVISVTGRGKLTSDWEISPGVPNIVNELNFDPMRLYPNEDSTDEEKKAWGKYKAFLPNHFFSIDIGYAYGELESQIDHIYIRYQEGANPNETKNPPGNGLGYKSSAVFAKKSIDVTGAELDDVIYPSGTRYLLKTLATQKAFTISTEIPSGWLRAYIGIATKDPADASTIPWPADAEVFNPGDNPGVYTGTLVITCGA